MTPVDLSQPQSHHRGMDRRRALLTGSAGVLGPSRSPQLDALRAFAVAGVLLYHFTRQPELGICAVAGVKLFFVLSGLLITRLLLVARRDVDFGRQRRSAALGHFYARRALRIFPLYYLVVAVSVAVDLAPAREIFPWLLSYTLNLHMARLGQSGHFAHLWTLAVEEQFYLVWPWLIVCAPRAVLVPTVVSLIALAPIYRLYGVATDMNAVALYVSPLASLDSLGMGALLALVTDGEFARIRLARCWDRLSVPACLAGTIVLYFISFHSPWGRAGFVAFDLVLALLFARLINAVAHRGLASPMLGSRPLVYLGTISYGIYVYHPFVLLGAVLLARWAGGDISQDSWAVRGVSAVATVGVASLSWHLFEHPINKLKRRLGGPYCTP